MAQRKRQIFGERTQQAVRQYRRHPQMARQAQQVKQQVAGREKKMAGMAGQVKRQAAANSFEKKLNRVAPAGQMKREATAPASPGREKRIQQLATQLMRRPKRQATRGPLTAQSRSQSSLRPIGIELEKRQAMKRRRKSRRISGKIKGIKFK